MRSEEEQRALRLARRTENDELRLQAGWPARVALRVPESDKAFFGLPYLFASAFPAVADEPLRRLALACKLLRDAELLRAMRAAPDAPPASAALRVAAQQLEANALFAGLFGGDARFWDALRGAERRFAHALAEEELYRAGRRAVAELDDAGALALAAAKTVSIPVALAGLAVLAGDDGARAPLARSVERYCEARQLLADLRAWKADLACGRATWVLARLARTAPEAYAARDVTGLTRALFAAGIARDALARAIASCEQSAGAVRGVAGTARWTAFAGIAARRAAALLGEMRGAA